MHQLQKGVLLSYFFFVLFFSLFNSSEDKVLIGHRVHEYLHRVEISFVNAIGGVIPYAVLLLHLVFRNGCIADGSGPSDVSCAYVLATRKPGVCSRDAPEVCTGRCTCGETLEAAEQMQLEFMREGFEHMHIQEPHVLRAVPPFMPFCAVVSEMLVYSMVEGSVSAYIKDMHLYLSPGSRLPLNPSGHTFMFLNGIFLLLPLVYAEVVRPVLSLSRPKRVLTGTLSLLVLYEYNRLLCQTVQYYHTFTDVACGVFLLCMFRAVTAPVRRTYRPITYQNEWGFMEYMGLGSLLLLLILVYK